MFFILSKLLSFLISPIIWIISLVALTLFLKNHKLKKKFAFLSFILLMFFTNSFILDEFFRLWEIGYMRKNEISQKYDYGILLGGVMDYDAEYHRSIFNSSGDRLLQTIELYHQNNINKIIVSSGSGSIIHRELKEADFIKDYLILIGIPETDIIIENKSRNTYENALYTRDITKNFNDSTTYLLITSAYHMRRSKACFEKVGLHVDIYAVDKKTGDRMFIFDHLFLPNKEALFYWDLLIHEVSGFIIYKLMGYA